MTRRIEPQRFARGRNAKAQCPICALVVPYRDLVRDWRNQRVCRDCYDPRHPQERPVRVTDPEGLEHPRPLQDEALTETPRRAFALHAQFAMGVFTVSVT